MAFALQISPRRLRDAGFDLQPTWMVGVRLERIWEAGGGKAGGFHRLLRIEPIWIAVAERYEGNVSVASAEGATAEEAWQNLWIEIDEARITTSYRVRVAGR